MRVVKTIALALGVIGLAGCTPEIHQRMRFPDLLHPGWANQQRQAAVEYDPYPLSDVGPEVVGGRPREYQQPVNEVERARMYSTRTLRARPTPASPWPTAPTTTFSSPSPAYVPPPASYPAATPQYMPPALNYGAPPVTMSPLPTPSTWPAPAAPAYAPPAPTGTPYSTPPKSSTFQQRQRSPY